MINQDQAGVAFIEKKDKVRVAIWVFRYLKNECGAFKPK
jgi:hypothetical protein